MTENFTTSFSFEAFTENDTIDYSNGSHYNNSMEDSNQFILPIWRQVLWTILFGGMVIVATGGNLIVIWIVLAHKRMRTVTNYFLLNLSIADTMVSTLNVTFNYVYMLNSYWPFGEMYCKISQFIAILSVSASVFSLMSISIDRYMAIMTPLRPRMGRHVTVILASCTWVLGIILGLPSLLYYKTVAIEYPSGEERIICFLEWPDGVGSDSSYDLMFNVSFLVITYLVPIVSMTYTYAMIGVELWGSQSIGECTQRQMENIKSKRRVVKMMMVVVIIFAVCWLPYQLYFVIIAYYPKITQSKYIQETFLAIYWLAMSNSMYNPIIYCWMNARVTKEVYGDNAVGYVQVKREGDVCTVKAKITPEHRVRNTPYTVEISVIEKEEKVLHSECKDCSASADFCIVDEAKEKARFRRGFKQFFSWLPCVHVTPGELSRREVFTSKRRSCSGSPDRNRIVRNGTTRATTHTNPFTTIGRPSPTSSVNTCYSQIPDLVLGKCELRQLS